MSVRTSEAPVTGSRGLQFRVLGPLEASRDGIALALGPRKQRAVLALLLLNANRVVPTERLIDDLWGEAPPETARSALQVYVAGLRKALGRDGAALRTSSPGYVLEVEPGALDLDRFAELRREARASADDARRAELLHDALALWRDTPLAELSAEPFSAAAATKLEQLRLGTLEERIDADLTLGRHAELVPELEALVAEHPYRERLRTQLMLALYRSGRQADALDAYQAGRRTLSEDLGLEPGQALRDLEAAILRQDESLALPARVEPEPRPVTVLHPHLADVAAPAPARRRVDWRVVGAIAVIVLLAVAAAVFLLRGEASPVTVPPNSAAVIDPRTNRVVATVPVGTRPGPLTAGAGSIWVGNLEDKTLSRVDPATRRVSRTIPLGGTPTGVAFGAGAVWVAHGLTGRLSRVDPRFDQVTQSVEITGKALYFASGAVAVGGGSVWTAFGDSTLARVGAVTVRELGSTLAGAGPAAVLAEGRWVWVANAGDSSVQRFDATTFEEGPVETPISVGRKPTGLASGEGAIWVASTGDDVVTQIDPGSRSTFTIPVGDGPTAVAVGAGSVWVANTAAGTVSRIDPATREVETIEVGGAPSGIAVVDGAIWVTVQAP